MGPARHPPLLFIKNQANANLCNHQRANGIHNQITHGIFNASSLHVAVEKRIDTKLKYLPHCPKRQRNTKDNQANQLTAGLDFFLLKHYIQQQESHNPRIKPELVCNTASHHQYRS